MVIILIFRMLFLNFIYICKLDINYYVLLENLFEYEIYVYYVWFCDCILNLLYIVRVGDKCRFLYFFYVFNLKIYFFSINCLFYMIFYFKLRLF